MTFDCPELNQRLQTIENDLRTLKDTVQRLEKMQVILTKPSDGIGRSGGYCEPD